MCTCGICKLHIYMGVYMHINTHTHSLTHREYILANLALLQACICDAQKATSLNYLLDMLMYVAINILGIRVKTWLM